VDNASVRGLALHSPPDTAQVVLPGDAANTPALLVAQPRRCKTGVLGGSGCAPDAVMGRTAGSVPPLAGPTGQTAQSRALVSALAQAPPRRPPRAA
jgi:hypothetical protein